MILKERKERNYKMKNVYVFGSLNMDLVFKSNVLPKSGETLSGDDFFINEGGKGANQAVAVSKQGCKTYMIGAVGLDVFGKKLVETLTNYHVDTTYVMKKENVSTGVAGILIYEHDNRILLHGGANQTLTKEDVDRGLEKIDSQDIFITQLENNIEMVEYGLKKAKEKGALCIFNPAPAKKIAEDALSCVDILILNESECETLSGFNLDEQEKLKSYFLSLNISHIIITLGSKGCLYIHQDQNQNYPAYKIKALDTTAAGDTFVGCFAAQYLKNKNIQESIEYATKASALTCLKEGAQQSIPTREEVEQSTLTL